MLSQKELKELFHYNPETGIFTRRASVSWNTKRGDIVSGVSNGYLRVNIGGKQYYCHQLAVLYMTGGLPEDDVDHINHLKTDNRWSNLRAVTRSENLKNCSLGKNNKHGVTGVHIHAPKPVWRAAISVNKKQIFLGQYSDFFEACCARKSAENKYKYHRNHGT